MQAPENLRALAGPVALVIPAFLFGGGGSPSVYAEGLVIFLAVVVATWMALVGNFEWSALPRTLKYLMGGLVALIVVQLIPLPPHVWHELPGRDALAFAFQAADAETQWWPVSIDPVATGWALLALIPPITVTFAVAALSGNHRYAILLSLVVCGIASAALQSVQLVTGDFYLYSRSIKAGPSGLFANQNSQADFMLITLLAIIALMARPSKVPHLAMTVILAATAMFIALSAILTGSRTGILLLSVPAIAAFYLLIVNRRLTFSKFAIAIAAAGVLAGIVAAQILIRNSAIAAKIAKRFDVTNDPRFEQIWPDAWLAAQLYWPYGSGIGTFMPAFGQVERLSVLDGNEANRAHNDFLEWIIETGLPGTALLTVALAIVTLRAIRTTSSQRVDPVMIFSAGTILLVAIHSLVDYPLRNLALAVAFAIGLGLGFSRKTV